ncbi:MAG: Xaa-Pro dipeptidyl-peptidase [Planctomycetota bacterium]
MKLWLSALLTCPLLAASLVTGSLLTGSLPGQNAEPARPVFKDGKAQQVKAFSTPGGWIRHDLWVETEFDSDGDGQNDRMHVDVTRPEQTESEGLRVPVIYETSPYFTGVGTTDSDYFWNPRHELGETPPERADMPPVAFRKQRPVIANSLVRTWLPRGFAVVHSSSPGTGMSQGCPTVGGDNESLAPKAVIDWLCGRAKGYTEIAGGEEVRAEWCTGKVGMTGTSYNGTLPLAAATTGVEGLEAIIPIAPNTSYYHYYRSNGLVRHPGGYMGEDVDVLYDFINSGEPKRREYCNREVRDGELVANADRVSGDYNDFWAGRDYLNELGPLRAATLMAHAFNDWNVMPEHSVRIYAALKAKGVPTMAFFHQGGHGGPPPDDLMNLWFTRYLYGVENDVELQPRSWIVREGDRRTDPTPYPDYPHPDAATVALQPRGGGAGVGDLSTLGGPIVGRETLTDDVAVPGADLAAAPRSPHRLLYATPPLLEELHLSGTARLKIRVAADADAANLSVWVVSLPWSKGGDITDNIITRGWADPQNHRSLRESEPLEPGRFYNLAFDLQPDDQIIFKGQRIGLMIFSSDRDFTLWPDAGTKLTVELGETSLALPVVGGATAMAQALDEV